MANFPHHYKVEATADPEGDVSLTSGNLDALVSAPPAEFGGPGDKWSPETLLVAAVADCFILSFRAIARASNFSWSSLKSDVTDTLDRSDGTTAFTQFVVHATLTVPRDTNEERARRLLQKAEETCLITNSLSATTHLEAEVLTQS
jgi:peroxiredoxin-like protein